MFEPSERASWGPVEEATWRAQTGVEVPIPRFTFNPPFGVMPRYEPVEVANFEFPPPDPDPQAVPVFENSPLASAWIHPVDPPREEKVGVPFESMVSAERVEVAKEVGLEVARYKFPPAFRKVQ